MVQKISRLAPWAPPESELVEQEWQNAIPPLFFILFLVGELCPGLVLVSSPVAKT